MRSSARRRLASCPDSRSLSARAFLDEEQKICACDTQARRKTPGLWAATAGAPKVKPARLETLGIRGTAGRDRSLSVMSSEECGAASSRFVRLPRYRRTRVRHALPKCSPQEPRATPPLGVEESRGRCGFACGLAAKLKSAAGIQMLRNRPRFLLSGRPQANPIPPFRAPKLIPRGCDAETHHGSGRFERARERGGLILLVRADHHPVLVELPALQELVA